MNYCPCCKDTLLCHISHNHIYWFCPSCWQEMPVCDLAASHSLTEVISGKLSIMHQKIEESSFNREKDLINSSELDIIHA
jgi:hypothetical protein